LLLLFFLSCENERRQKLACALSFVDVVVVVVVVVVLVGGRRERKKKKQEGGCLRCLDVLWCTGKLPVTV